LRFITCFFYLVEWTVSITTGIYEPKEENAEKSQPVENEEDEQTAVDEEGENEEEEQGEAADEENEGEPEQEEEGEEEEDNTNNNADDETDNINEDGKTRKKSPKYLVPPKPPTSSLVMVLYGDRGKTQPLPLVSGAPTGTSSFQPGSTDDFKVYFYCLQLNVYTLTCAKSLTACC